MSEWLSELRKDLEGEQRSADDKDDPCQSADQGYKLRGPGLLGDRRDGFSGRGRLFFLECSDEGDDVAECAVAERGVAASGRHGEVQHGVGVEGLTAHLDEAEELVVAVRGDELARAQWGTDAGDSCAGGAVAGEAGLGEYRLSAIGIGGADVRHGAGR